MNFKKHSELEGLHAFLSPSKYHWINYDQDKLSSVYKKHMATERGTKLHELACMCISLGVRLPKNRNTLNAYVNDAISYHMSPEVPLKYSRNCFGTADAISFRKNLLRIHDYKSGEVKARMMQLKIYAALFCLEYDIDPYDIDTNLRIYQNNEIEECCPDGEEIDSIMKKIVEFDELIESIMEEEFE